MGYKILLLSGREEVYRPQTEAFLQKHHIGYDGLWMRQKNDYRKDAVIKKELFRAHIDGQYRVEFGLDDRDQVVELWRKLLPCSQVAYGDF
ncbi:phosphatase domain-containing protein [Parapedobacter tibetensis]|uniref:phosphatase domain-containing protein n=1 Tax=Parapedobacter tibetensis TaxID=2972951 RepID=UPI00214D46CD|nr:hypothetical protein [Parapedobacter tibetensis]